MEAEFSCEHSRTNDTRIDEVNTKNLMKDRKHVLRREELNLKEMRIGRGRRMKRFIAINGSDYASIHESLP